MVAITFANVAMELIVEGKTGQMTAIREGGIATARSPSPGPGRWTSSTPTTWSAIRPQYEDKLGLPVLLTPSVV